MGSTCSSNIQTPMYFSKRNKNINIFHGTYNSGNHIPQVIFLGPKGGGKTTLLYSTIFPNKSIHADIVLTKTFHYEEITIGLKKIGLWDIGGNDLTQYRWTSFYKLIHFDVVFFVISLLNLDDKSAKMWLQRLLCEVELHDALIILIVNTFDKHIENINDEIKKIHLQFDISNLEIELTKKRLNTFIVNAKNCSTDDNWQAAVSLVINKINNMPSN